MTEPRPRPAKKRATRRREVGEPRRVVVSSPRTLRARALSAGDGQGAPGRRFVPGCPAEPGWSIVRDLDEQTELGAVYVRSLIRAQLRTALVTLGIVTVVVIGLPLLMLVPVLSGTRLYGVPLPWLGLALFVQPLWIAAAARHLRQAERTEREFARLVDRS